MSVLHENLLIIDPQEEDQKVNSDLLKLVLEFKDYSIVMLDATGHIISWNEGAEYMYGYKPEEVMGKHESILYTLTDVQNGQPQTNLNLAEKNGRHGFESLKRKKNGMEFYTDTIINASYNAAKTIRGFVKITRDIDLRKRLETANKILHDHLEEKVAQRTKELLIVNKELEAFSYSVSHDLRSPLRAIGGFSNMLKKKYEPIIDSDGKRIIDVIVDKARLMGLLIDDLLTFSRMARLEIMAEGINMKRIAESCVADLLLPDAPGKYTVRLLDMPECKGDASMLKQVWYNLLGNAIKYSAKKASPEIVAGATEDEDKIIYYVKDNGAGFEMKYANNLFGVFQRLHRNDEFEGTGLGLALAKRIVSKHGGEIWAESQLNEGANFYFSIPKNI